MIEKNADALADDTDPNPPISVRTKDISNRIISLLNADRVLNFYALQYQLCETGPQFRRLDPRELRTVLKFLADNPKPGESLPHGPWEPQPRIFVSPRISRRESRHHAKVAAGTKVDQLRAVAGGHFGDRALRVGAVVAATISKDATIEGVNCDATELLGGEVSWSAQGCRFYVSSHGGMSAALVWITANLSWLFPDDPALWQHLFLAHERKVLPVIIGRKLAISTFPLLKRMGGIGLQLHHLYLPGNSDDPMVERGLEGGPRVFPVQEARDHVAVAKNLPDILKTRYDPDPNVRKALKIAKQVGLDSDSADRLQALRGWTDRAPIAMPPPWKAQLTKYENWSRVDGSQVSVGVDPL